jgi:RNA polymerase sigma-70 factor (sigma-E family)
VRADEERNFREFVSARIPSWRRSAFLLCGDPHRADDLVSTATCKLFRHWRRISRLHAPDAYVRRIVVTAWLDEGRRPWRREWSTDRLPDQAAAGAPHDAVVTDRIVLLELLDRLPRRRRAVLVLRFLDDLSVEETAQILGCAPGTVKAHTSRGLADLRALIGPEFAAAETYEEDRA